MKRIARYLPLCLLAFGSVQFAAAQNSFDLNMGFGSFHDGAAAATGYDGVTGNPCSSVASDPNCIITATNGLGGFFLGFGMDMLFKKNLGAGFEWDLTPAHSNYSSPSSSEGITSTIQYRQHFIDFDGIWAPVNNKKFVLKIMPGIGDAKTGISEKVSECIVGAVCGSEAEPFNSQNHFQMHVGIGFEVFVTDHWFIRPQFDFHYVVNFTQEFANNTPIGGMVFVGYSWGDR